MLDLQIFDFSKSVRNRPENTPKPSQNHSQTIPNPSQNPSTLVGVLEPSIRREGLPSPLPPSLWTPWRVFKPNPGHPRGWTCFGPKGAKTTHLDTGSLQGIIWDALGTLGTSSMMNRILRSSQSGPSSRMDVLWAKQYQNLWFESSNKENRTIPRDGRISGVSK